MKTHALRELVDERFKAQERALELALAAQRAEMRQAQDRVMLYIAVVGLIIALVKG